MRIGINGSASLLQGTLDSVVDDVAATREAGFGSYWLAQTSAVDALTALAVAGARGTAGGMTVGTAVVPTYVQHPLALAAQAWTANAACGGRLVLGIGLNHEPMVRQRLGMDWDPPLAHMGEYLDVLFALFEEGKVDVDGKVWTAHAEARLRHDPPRVMVAAMGPQMLRLAGRRTDGTILWMVGPATIRRHIAPVIREAAAEAGRPEPEVVCSLPVCVTDDAERVRGFAAMAFAGYGELPSYRAMLDREGAAGPEDVCIIGDEAHVRGVLDELALAGTTEFAAVNLGTDDEERARTRELLLSWSPGPPASMPPGGA